MATGSLFLAPHGAPGEAALADQNHLSSLSNHLERLEQQIARLTDLLADQASTGKRRRRVLTLRVLLVSIIGFAALFAWFGSLYRQSRRQAAAVDKLIDQCTFVLYSPRESALVSILPGDAQRPSASLVKLLGDDFFRSVTNVSTGRRSSTPRDKQQILTALTALPQLERLRLTNMQLGTHDLVGLHELRKLQSIDVTRTGLDSGGMPWLADTEMRWFNASHTCFSNRALYDLSKCRQLRELRLERTCVTDEGLIHLYAMPNLRYINLKRCPVTQAAVKRLSDALPGCVIDWEPLRFLADGKVDSAAARKGRIELGRRIPQDPRGSRRAAPPMDSAPVQSLPTWSVQPSGQNVRPYNGFLLDVF